MRSCLDESVKSSGAYARWRGVLFVAIGVASLIALVVFNRLAKRWKDMNV
jgi:hypothetical protein